MISTCFDGFGCGRASNQLAQDTREFSYYQLHEYLQHPENIAGLLKPLNGNSSSGLLRSNTFTYNTLTFAK